MGPIRRVCKRYSGRYCLEQPGSGGVGCSHLGADRVEQVGHCQETLWTEPGGLHCVMGAPGRQRKQQIQVPCQGPRTSAGNSWSQRWCLASGLRQPEWEHCLATLCGGHHQTGVPRQALLTPQASCSILQRRSSHWGLQLSGCDCFHMFILSCTNHTVQTHRQPATAAS